ncbi:MAG: DUF6931 family protein [Stellaceae bacterium]
MAVPSYIKIKQAPASELCDLVTISDEGLMLVRPDMAAAAFFDALGRKNLLLDAIRFLAAALPAREAVWWACVCAQETLPGDAAPALKAALVAAESWVYRPDEETRRAAKTAADAAGLHSAASWAAMAAFWSGGSIVAPETPAVEPHGRLLPAAAGGAVMLAGVQSEPQRADQHHRRFLAAGIDIANGGNGQPKAAKG